MSRPAIGQPAPRFELPIHRAGSNAAEDAPTWSLDDHTGRGSAVVLVFHRHIH